MFETNQKKRTKTEKMGKKSEREKNRAMPDTRGGTKSIKTKKKAKQNKKRKEKDYRKQMKKEEKGGGM